MKCTLTHFTLTLFLCVTILPLSAVVPSTAEMAQCEPQTADIRKAANSTQAMPVAKFKAYSYSNPQHEILWEKHGDDNWNDDWQTWALDEDNFVRVRAADYTGEGATNYQYLYLQLCFWVNDFSVTYNGKIGPKEGVYTVRQAQYYGYGYWYLDNEYLNNSIVGDANYATSGYSWSTSMNTLWNPDYHSPYCAFIAEKTCDWCTPNYFSLIPVNSTATVTRGKDDKCYVVLTNPSGVVLFTIGEPAASVTKNVSITPPANGGITVNYNDGSAQTLTSGNRDIDENTVLTITATPNPGYHNTSLAVNGSPFTSGNNLTLTEDITLSAAFEANTYSVRFNSNGGTGDAMADQLFTYDEALKSLSANTYTRESYTFNGWNTKADGSGIQYTDGQPVGNLSTTDNDVVTLYAQWNAVTYTVTYHENGGPEIPDGSYTAETLPFTLPTADDISREGYTFGGWYDNEGLEGTAAASISTGAAGDKEYWAQWTEKEYTVVLDKGTEGSADGVAVVSYLHSTLTSITPVSANGSWQLAGYFTSATDGELVISKDGKLMASVSGYTDAEGRWTNTGESVVLYAQWTEALTTLTLSADKGGKVNDGVNGTYHEGDEVTAIATPDNFYTFTGWTDDNNGDALVSEEASYMFTITAQTDLTARFAVNTALVLPDDKQDAYYDEMAEAYFGDGTSPVSLVSVTYVRSFTANQWAVFSLPFNWYVEADSELDGYVYEYTGATGDVDNGLEVTFAPTDYIEAGKPYLMKPEVSLTNVVFTADAEGDNPEITLTDAISDADGDKVASSTNGGSSPVRFIATNRRFSFPKDESRKQYIFLNRNRLYFPGANGNTMRPFRAFFLLPEAGSGLSPRMRIVAGGEVVTEIEEAVYDGDGGNVCTRKYIENGVLIIERNGIRYDATGARIR